MLNYGKCLNKINHLEDQKAVAIWNAYCEKVDVYDEMIFLVDGEWVTLDSYGKTEIIPAGNVARYIDGTCIVDDMMEDGDDMAYNCIVDFDDCEDEDSDPDAGKDWNPFYNEDVAMDN